MDADGEAMIDAAVEREIQALLAAEPSPEFGARVRTRIANEPQTSRLWSPRWMIVAGASAMAALVVFLAIVVSSGDRRSPAAASPLRARTFAEAVTVPSTVPSARMVPRATMQRVSRGGTITSMKAAVAAARGEPEILVDAREATAIRTFVEEARRGRVDLTAIVDTAAPVQIGVSEATEILFAPIPLAPLIVGADDKGVRQ